MYTVHLSNPLTTTIHPVHISCSNHLAATHYEEVKTSYPFGPCHLALLASLHNTLHSLATIHFYLNVTAL